MNHLKKILVLTLVATMVLGLAGSGFAAAPRVITTAFSDVKGHEAEGAFAFLGALEVYRGDKGIGGPARPDDPITRAEFAAVLVRAMGKEKTAQSMSNYVPDFADAAQIPSWAWGYVKVASTLGLVKGYEDGTFRANNNVTQAEALAMLVRAIGHESLVKGVWPGNYVTYGYEVGIAEGLDVFANMPATRGEVARMVENAMKVVCYNAVSEKYDDDVAEKGDGDGEVDSTKEEILCKATLRAGALRSGWQLWAGKVLEVNEVDAKIKIDPAEGGGAKEVGLDSQVVLFGVSSLQDLLNCEIEAVGKGDRITVILPSEQTEVVAGVFKDDDAVGTSTITINDGRDEYDFASSWTAWINGITVSTAELDDWANRNAAGDQPLFKELGAWPAKQFVNGDYSSVDVSLGLNEDGDVASVKFEYYDIYDAVVAEDPKEADPSEQRQDIVAKLKLSWGGTAVGGEVKIMKDTVITVNGKAATWQDLKEDMSVYVMRKPSGWTTAGGFTIPNFTDKAYKIAAYDRVVTAEVKSYAVSGSYVWITADVDGRTVTYRSSRNFLASGEDSKLVGVVTLGLNMNGHVYKVLEAETEYDYVRVKGIFASSEKVAGTDYYKLGGLEVDRRGQGTFIELKTKGSLKVNGTTVTVVVYNDNIYTWDGSSLDNENFITSNKPTPGAPSFKPNVIELAELSADGKLIAIKVPDGSKWEKKKVSSVSFDGIVILKNGSTVVAEKPAVYEDDFDYIGTAKLSKGEEVYTYTLSDGTVIGLWRP